MIIIHTITKVNIFTTKNTILKYDMQHKLKLQHIQITKYLKRTFKF